MIQPITIISDYEHAYDMPPVEELGGREWIETMNKIDPEAWKHIADVYGPWTAKPWMVQHAKDLQVYDSKYFFWVRHNSSIFSRLTEERKTGGCRWI